MADDGADQAFARAQTTQGQTCIVPVPNDVALPPIEHIQHKQFGGPSQVWPYHDQYGRLLGAVARFDLPAGGKQVLPLTCWDKGNGPRWEWKGAPEPRPIYGLDRLAARLGAPVLVVEGEKTADAAGAIFRDHVVVTSPSGANAAGKADWTALRGRQVVIWPDADEAGQGYAAAVAQLAQAAGAASVSVVAVPKDFPPAWDLADELPDGANLDGLRTILDTAQPAAVAEGPLPLRRALTDPEPFPIHSMDVLRAAAEAIQDKTQAPIAICAQSVLAAVSLAAHAHVDVVLPTGSRRPTSCFFVTVAASGERKSSCDDLAMKEVAQYQAELLSEYGEQLQSYSNRRAVWDQQRESILKSLKSAGRDAVKRAKAEADLSELGPAPEAPLVPQIICQEPTIEGLFKMLKHGIGFGGLMSAEGGAFIGGFGMSADHKLKTAAHLSNLWDGASIDRTRGGEELSVLRGRRAGLHLMVQPVIAERLLSDAELIGQGLLSRMLVAAPPPAAGSRLWREASPKSAIALQLFETRLKVLLRSHRPHADGRPAELTPRAMPLSAEARPLWIDYHDKIESQLGPKGLLAPIAGFAAKLPEHAARLAAVLTAAGNLKAPDIDAERMLCGIVLAEFYKSEALRLFEAGATDPDLVLTEKVLAFIRERGGLVSLRCVYTHGPNAAREKATAERVMRILEDHRWVERAEGAEIEGRKARMAWRLLA